ncbi:MAG: error-prone DNA polymerase [Planctomycetes bacterium]|nr:error-prone DNA polymerase [Planctomycetota bacterium]
MPEAPTSRPRRPDPPAPPSEAPAPACAYAELHARTNYSFLTGASHPDELVARAAALGYRALAVTDEASLAGVVRAHVAAKAAGLHLIVGAELRLRDAPAGARLVVHARDRAGYGRLSRLITIGRRRIDRAREAASRYDLWLRDIEDASDGLLVTLAPGEDLAGLEPLLQRLRARRGDDASLGLTLLRGPDDRARLEAVRALGARAGVPLVALGDVLMHDPARRRLAAALACVREGTTLAGAGRIVAPNAERALRPTDDLVRLFAAAPEALARTVELARRCTFSLDELRYEYPEELVPPGETTTTWLRRLTEEGAARRYPGGVPAHVRALIEHELALVAELAYEPYFLTVHDIVRFARARGILCQGRGSAANSAVCFCLGITAVDPARTEVLFERFVSRARREPPDIDVDFEHERREEVLQYVYEKYGRERAAITGEVITYRGRSAMRDLGKALGLSLDQVDRLAATVDWEVPEPARLREAGLDPASPTGRLLLELVTEAQGFPRHLSQHVGGFVISRGPLVELVPVENAPMPGRTFIEWDKDDLDALGLLKVDCLALGMLTCVQKTLDLVRAERAGEDAPIRPELDLATIPAEDPAVYDMLCRADTLGVFQIESRAQMAMLPRLRPRCFYDLVVEVSIVRPGPIQGGIVHPYLRRRKGEEAVVSICPEADEVLRKTLGVPVFQEQAMRLAIEVAGFTPDEADALRKAMGAWRRQGSIDGFRERFVRGVMAKGVARPGAEELFERIRGFGEYGFPESHAASFALLVYASAWLKRYHPAAFAAGLLNSQPMGFYAPAQIVADARAHGVEVRPPCVQASAWDCALEAPVDDARRGAGATAASAVQEEAPERWGAGGPALRLGLRLIAGLGERAGRAIAAAREGSGSFRSLDDLARRAGLGRDALERLAHADALRGLGLERRRGLYEALARRGPEPPLFRGADLPDEAPDLPALSALDAVLEDYAATGLSLRAHPLAHARQAIQAHAPQARPCAWLREAPFGARATVAGLVICRQRPSTAQGITFFTLEDESGVANLIVRQDVFERFRRVAREARCLLVEGTVEREGEVVHLLVRRLEDLARVFQGARVAQRSRDFR